MLTNGIENNSNLDMNIFSKTIKKIINLKFGFNIIKEGLTHPIIRLNNEITNSISLPQRNVYDIPIYIVIEIGNNIHASIIILYKKKVYTFGYGYSFTDKNFIWLHKGNGAIYTQDYLFQPEVAKFKYRVIDIGELNQHHISKINSILHDVRFINSKFIDINPTTVFNSTNILSGEKIPRYSTISNQLTKTLNCTSFVRYIFGDRVTCGLFVEDPKSCRRINTPYYITESHINTLSELYLKGNYNNLKGFLRTLD